MQAAQWAKLSDLIGSADGMKFRRMAQRAIFELLTTNADKHLRRFSQRYCLQSHPETFEVCLIDQDLLSQPRDIKSLNAGEKFLVSLSLAMGLATLLSENVEMANLFIDEGFDALSGSEIQLVLTSLQHFQKETNCKVGILSHAPQLIGTIMPEVRLSKILAGKTRIAIQ